MARPRFAVLGCGSIGKRHVKNLLALGEKDILAFDPRADRRAEAEALGLQTTGELDAVWSARPEAVLVTSPSRLHVTTALAAAEAGCHLFVEKPISDVHDDALDRLIEVVREKKLITLVGCNLRFHPGLARAKAILDEKRLGRVVSIRAEFGQYLPDWHPWEDYRQGYSARQDLGGGIVLDAIHELDYARWLMGEVEAVSCFAGSLSRLGLETEDVAAILLRFACGAIGEVHLDYVQRAYSRTCQLVGEEGTLRWDFVGGETRLYDAAAGAWRSFPAPAGWETNDMYVAELEHFLACLDGEAEPAQDLRAGRRALEIALAALASAENGVVVKLASEVAA
jgi:predicted dehydrogenase